MKLFILIILSLLVFGSDYGPPKKDSSLTKEVYSVGIGYGLDYNLFGGKFMLSPTRVIGLFVSAGHNTMNFNAGIGAQINLIGSQKKRSNFYLLGVYSNNFLVVLQDGPLENKDFYGFSFGVGYQYRSRSNDKRIYSFSLNYPIESGEALDYLDQAEQAGYEISREGLPLKLSAGVRFILN